MNPFIYFSKKRREQRRKLKELKQFSSTFSTLDRLEQSGLLTFDSKSRRLFIAQSLAVLMMKDAQSWVNFITNVYQWLYYQQAQEAWNAHFLKEELAAVRKASGSMVNGQSSMVNGQLSRADVERIRLAARQQVAESDIEPPKIEPFEFFIVQDTTDAAAKLIAVGYFNPETNDMELAPWSEVEPLIKKAQEP